MAGNTWLLTWTTYGTWLPGDERGFVGYVREKPADWRPRLDTETQPGDAQRADDASRRVSHTPDPSRRVIHNIPGTPYDGSIPALKRYAESQMKGEPIWLTRTQAEVFLAESQRTAEYRHWQLLAVAVMANHVHLVVVVVENIPGERLLQEFKSYGSRVLNARFGKPTSGTWWTKSGSTRVLPNERAVRAAVEYVRNQQRPLVVWIAGEDPSTNVERSEQHPSTGVEEQHPSTGVDGSLEHNDDAVRADDASRRVNDELPADWRPRLDNNIEPDDAFRPDDASRRVQPHDQPGRKKKGGGE